MATSEHHQDNNLSISPRSFQSSSFSPSKGLHLPPEDPGTIRSMMLSAAWAHGLLQSPPHVSRKCPVLPNFVPRSNVDGLVHVATKSEGSFHGALVQKQDEQNSSPQCPYHH